MQQTKCLRCLNILYITCMNIPRSHLDFIIRMGHTGATHQMPSVFQGPDRGHTGATQGPLKGHYKGHTRATGKNQHLVTFRSLKHVCVSNHLDFEGGLSEMLVFSSGPCVALEWPLSGPCVAPVRRLRSHSHCTPPTPSHLGPPDTQPCPQEPAGMAPFQI